MSSNIKSLKKKQAQPHPTTSFAQAMSNAQLNALKPYIQEQMGLIAQQIAQSLYQSMMQERAMTQTRQLAFERLLKQNAAWFNDDVLAMTIAEVEDESENYVEVLTEAEAGDKVRLSFKAKPYDKGEWSQVSKLAIHSLTTKGPNGDVQVHSDLETNVLGMKTGETKEFLIPEVVKDGEEPQNTRVEVSVMRISRSNTVAAVSTGDVK